MHLLNGHKKFEMGIKCRAIVSYPCWSGRNEFLCGRRILLFIFILRRGLCGGGGGGVSIGGRSSGNGGGGCIGLYNAALKCCSNNIHILIWEISNHLRSNATISVLHINIHTMVYPDIWRKWNEKTIDRMIVNNWLLITLGYSIASSHFGAGIYSYLHDFCVLYADRPTLAIDTNNMSYYCPAAMALAMDDCRLKGIAYFYCSYHLHAVSFLLQFRFGNFDVKKKKYFYFVFLLFLYTKHAHSHSQIYTLQCGEVWFLFFSHIHKLNVEIRKMRNKNSLGWKSVNINEMS